MFITVVGDDVLIPSRVLRFSSGDNRSCVGFTTVKDAIIEDTEEIQLSLIDTFDIRLGAVVNITLSINDDDGKHFPVPHTKVNETGQSYPQYPSLSPAS